jgi:hypothetical protein
VNTSSPPNIPSKKRPLGPSIDSPAKRMRTSDTPSSSGVKAPLLKFTTAKRHHGQLSTTRPPPPGVMARVDCASVNQSLPRFDTEVKDPILRGMNRLRTGCIHCLFIGSADWRGHGYDYCVEHSMNYGKDLQFVDFKSKFKFVQGFCYTCGLNLV